MTGRQTLWMAVLLVAAACVGTGAPPPTDRPLVETTEVTVQATSTLPLPEISIPATSPPAPLAHASAPDQLVEIPDAVVIGVAVNGRDEPVVAWISDAGVDVARLGADGALTEPTRLNRDIEPFAHPIERPAVALRDDGSIDVAFTALVGAGGSVFHARLTADEVEGPSSRGAHRGGVHRDRIAPPVRSAYGPHQHHHRHHRGQPRTGRRHGGMVPRTGSTRGGMRTQPANAAR